MRSVVRKLISLFLVVCLICPGLPAMAEPVEKTGVLGETLTYSFENGVLTFGFYGKPGLTPDDDNYGTMPSFWSTKTPWYNEKWASSITSVVIPEGIKNVSDYAFLGCTGITKIELPNSVTSLGTGVFSGCSSLREIQLPPSLTKAGNTMFGECESLVSVVLPDGFDDMRSAFFNCKSLESVSIPSTAKLLSYDTFFGCEKLKNVTISESSPSYCAVDNVIFSKDKTKLIYYPAGLTGTTYTVPSETTLLGKRAFYNVPSLREVVISEGTAPLTIGEQTSSGAVDSAFLSCDNLTSLRLPARLKAINYRGLSSIAKSMVKVYYSGTAADWCGISTSSTDDYLRDFYNNSTFYRVDSVEDISSAEKACMLTFTPGEGGTRNPSYAVAPFPVPAKQNEGFTLPGAAYTLSPPTGGHFVGWKAGDKVYRKGETYPVEGDTEFAAVWFEENEVVVNLNVNGGSGIYPAYQLVKKGEPYGTLKTPSRSGYHFLGWFTAKEGGEQVTAESLYPEEGGPTGLYAHWTDATPTAIALDPNGGTLSVTTANVFENQVYPSLPIPTWEGYDFAGWYTAAQGGTAVAGTVFTTDVTTLYAHWTKRPDTIVITLNANGGGILVGTPSGGSGPTYVETSTRTATVGSGYTGLDLIPHREGYTFVGWYTAPQGGEPVANGETVTKTTDFTLYAHWSKSVSEVYDKIKFGFANMAGPFGYPEGYKIPYTRYRTVFGNNARAKTIYQCEGPWRGSCYGMATSAGLLYETGNGIEPPQFTGFNNESSSLTSGLKVDWRKPLNNGEYLTVRGLIECMQVSAIRAILYYENVACSQDYANLVRYVKRVEAGECPPVNINVYNSRVGHALLGYAVEEGLFEDRIFVYDSARGGSSRAFIQLKKNAAGNYTGFSYADGTYQGIMYVYYYDQYYQDASFAVTSPSTANAADDENRVLLVTDAKNAKILDAGGKVAAQLTDGAVKSVSGQVVQVLSLSESGEASDTDKVALWLPQGQYTLENGGGAFKAMVAHIDQAATVETSSSQVTFRVDDGAEGGPVNEVTLQNGAAYRVTLETAAADGTYEEILLAGTGEAAGTAKLSFSKSGGTIKTTAPIGSVSVGRRTYQLAEELEKGDYKEPDSVDGNWQGPAVPGAPSGGTDVPELAPDVPFEMDTQVTLVPVAPETPSDSGTHSPSPGKPGESPVEPPKPSFSDVAEDAWYREAVDYVAGQGLMTGTSSGVFSPKKTTSRAMALTVLYRMAGEPAPLGGAFADVPEGSWYHAPAAWAKKAGVAQGIGQDRLAPHADITREQLAVLLYRYAKSQGIVCTASGDLENYADALTISDWAWDAMDWANGAGLFNGRGQLLAPKAKATRGELAEIIMRYCELYKK